jgi:hypothetical protein
MKQTAVEFIETEFNKLLLKIAFEKLSALEVDSLRTKIINQAKEMEKNQLIDAVHCNWLVDDDEQVSGLEYLKEEFGKE